MNPSRLKARRFLSDALSNRRNRALRIEKSQVPCRREEKGHEEEMLR